MTGSLCRACNIKPRKPFGKADNVCNVLSGAAGTPKWETNVVMASATKAQPVNSK